MPDLYVAKDTIYIPQGGTFQKWWHGTDANTGGNADWTGWSARCEVRTDYGGDLLTRFRSSGGWDGTIVFESGTGNFYIQLDAVYTAALPVWSNAVFDVEGTNPSGKPWRLVEGRAHITPEATTDA